MKITAVCPSCGRKLAPLPFMRVATVSARRTCRSCNKAYQIKVVPNRLKKLDGYAHVLTFVEVTK